MYYIVTTTHGELVFADPINARYFAERSGGTLREIAR